MLRKFIVVVALAVIISVAYLLWGRQIDNVQSLEGIPFNYVEIDPSIAGDCKMVGDIDGDGFPDLIIGGMPSEKLNWYQYPSWKKTIIATPSNEFTTDCAVGDVDGDGDIDIVVPDGDSGNNLLWFENPLPSGDATVEGQWTRHEIGAIGSWGKDVELSDFDGNGFTDVATRNPTQAMVFFQTSANVWSKTAFDNVELGDEGMASGDIDSDGDVDLVLRGVWLRNPGGMAARTGSNWLESTIGTANANFKALVVDINHDGKMDVLFSSSEGTADVDWWTPVGGDPTGPWSKFTIVPNLQMGHTLQAADMDNDGDMDVVIGQMHISDAKQLMIMFNTNGQGTAWSKELVASNGLHNGVVADIGNDGDYDIFGANWTGNPPVKLWVNQLNPDQPPLPLNKWTYKQVSDAHAQTFGLDFDDIDGDGNVDILSGSYWYVNPGGDLLGVWQQNSFPSGMNALLSLDVDGDSLPDVIAHKDEGDIALYWLEATNESAANWNSVKIGTVEQASHELGAQGHRIAQIEAGGSPEIATSSGAGVYYFRIPANPEAGNWPRVHISSNPSDEGFAFGDIDKDGDLDLAATTGDSMNVEWYVNPGNGSAEWEAITIGQFSNAVYPDRTEIADVNDDTLLDIIATEENGGDSDAETYWWEAPADPKTTNWTRHLLVSQGTTNSMDVADMNQDGTTDIILGEHRGTKKLSIWSNYGDTYLTEQVVDVGKESHLGARVVDIDQDGDLDIVSIAWDAPQYLHLWRNDAITEDTPPPSTVAAPKFLPVEGTYSAPLMLTLSTSTAGASIYYTLDGNEPTMAALPYAQPISITTDTVIKARAFKDGSQPSNIVSGTYQIEPDTGSPPTTVAAPVFSPGGGTYSSPIQLAISTDTDGASVYYTVDSSVPTTDSFLFEQPIAVVTDTEVVARAFKQGLLASEVVSVTYQITPETVNEPEPVAAPEFSHASGTYSTQIMVSLSTSTEGASVYYTLDGSEPTTDSLLYEQPILITKDTVVKARTFKVGSIASEVVSAVYKIAPQQGSGRVTDGLAVLYTFLESEGTVVRDVSGGPSSLDLAIQNPNAVRWLPSGLQIVDSTLLFAQETPTKLIEALQNSGNLSLEAWISLSSRTQEGPARIIALTVDPQPTGGNLVLGQEFDSLQVRLRTTETDQYGLPSLNVATDAVADDFMHVVFTRESTGATRLYLNGALVASGTSVGTLANWESGALFSLANEPNGQRPWIGTLHLVAIYARALSESEVAQNFDAGSGTPFNPSNYLRIPEISR